MGLRAGSPAIGLVSSNCATTDQRGVRRPVGGRCDAGAFEGTLTTPGGGTKASLGSPKARFNLKKRRLTLPMIWKLSPAGEHPAETLIPPDARYRQR